MPLTYDRAVNTVIGFAVFLPGIHFGAMYIPEINIQFSRTAIQQIDIIYGLIIMIILSRNLQSRCFNTHIDVFSHQNDFDVRKLLR